MDEVLVYWLLLTVKAIVWVVECFTDALMGYTMTAGSRQERLQAKSGYESSAQIVDVVWRAKESIFKTSRLENFLYKHVRYVHPRYIRDNKNVSLLAVERDYALFCVTDPTTNIYDTTQFPFLLVSQYLEAKQLVILPISSFHKLANEIGDPKVKVTMVNMTARCGSTLLSQLFNLVPGTRSMAEPWAMCNVHELRSKHTISTEETKELLRSAVRIHCKIAPGEELDRIVLKMCPFNAAQFAYFKELFPDFTYLFNTRHPVPSIKSLEGALKMVGGNLYYKLGITWREFIGARMAFPYDSKYDSKFSFLSKYFPNVSIIKAATVFYTAVLASYFDHKDIYEHTVLYENLVNNSEEEVKKIFQLCDIPEKYIPLALKALQRDSQNGMFGGVGQNKTKQMDKALLDFCDSYMKEVGVPLQHDTSIEELKKIFDA